MKIEDELLCVLASVIIQKRKSNKKKGTHVKK